MKPDRRNVGAPDSADENSSHVSDEILHIHSLPLISKPTNDPSDKRNVAGTNKGSLHHKQNPKEEQQQQIAKSPWCFQNHR
jgi:hypothetical protein